MSKIARAMKGSGLSQKRFCRENEVRRRRCPCTSGCRTDWSWVCWRTPIRRGSASCCGSCWHVRAEWADASLL